MPKVKKVLNHGKVRWRVIVPVGLEHAKRRRFFASKAEADRFVALINSARSEAGGELLRLSPQDQALVIRALERCGSATALDAAVTSWMSTRPNLEKPLPEMAAEFLADREAAGLRLSYLRSIRSAVSRFVEGRHHLNCSEVRTEDCEQWLAGYPLAVTRQGYLKDLRTLFNFALKRGYVASNPAMSISRPKADDKPPGILSVDEAERLLRTCERVDPGLLPVLVVSLFAGLRPYEAVKLEWSDVSEESINVRSEVSKTRRRRMATVLPNLREWLALGGDLPPRNILKRSLAVKTAAGIPWPHDCLRHSFASYHLAAFQSPDKTAHEMGHSSTAMLYAHYRELVSKAEAERFWNLRPTGSADTRARGR